MRHRHGRERAAGAGVTAELTMKRIRRGSFTSVLSLEKTIRDYLAKNNTAPKPFRWHKTADEILASIARFATATLQAHGVKN